MKIVPAVILALALAGCATHTGRPEGAQQPARVLERYDVQHDLAYGAAGLTGDLYLPRGAGPYPGVLAIHGGGWDSRDRGDMDLISAKLAARGYVVFNIDYRLAPAALYPAQIDDVRAALKWMRANAARLKLDGQRLGAWGYSAGAHLAALAATDPQGDDTRLQAVVAGGTPSDLRVYPVSPIITKFIGKSYADDPKTWTAASPIVHVSKDDPPMFLYHGTWDRLVYESDSEAMKAALDAAGVPAELYLLHGLGHIAVFALGFTAENAGVDFLDRTLR